MTVLWWTYAKEEQKLSDKWEQSKVEQEKVGDREELSREVNESSVKWVLKLSQRMFTVKEPVGRKKGGKFAHHVHFIVDSPFYPLISVPAESVIASPYKYNISK